MLPSKYICRVRKTSDINDLTLKYTTLVKRNIKNAHSSIHPNLPKNITKTHVAIN
jgi:hypothetical protein